MLIKPIEEYSSWHVIYTYSGFEKKVNNVLLKNKFNTYLPLQKVARQWSDRKKIVEVPLFPNYIFVQTSAKRRFDILNIQGISHYVAFNKRPVCVSDEEIGAIRTIMIEPEVAVEKYIDEGHLVRLTEGPFIGLKGIVFEKKGKKRIGIKIESINQILSIEVCESSIEKILIN